MPQNVQSEPPPPSQTPSLQGLAATREDERALLDALEKAFDYRGDVTLWVTGGSGPLASAAGERGGAEQMTGYIFDRRRGSTLDTSTLRLIPAPPHPEAGSKVAVRYSQIARVEFTGKDTAHGKTFESWVKRFTEKRLQGERAGIDSEDL